jgi:O-acetyl-ADP-ribose deacetylase (regulator of RNase III)
MLAACYRNSLTLARDTGVRSIAFPAISTGAYGFPGERACKIALREVQRFLETNLLPEEVRLVCFDRHTADVYRSELEKLRR